MVTKIGGTGKDDILYASGDAEAFYGSHGFDFVSYENSDIGVTLMLDRETGGLANDAAGDMYQNIEGVIGSNQHDDIYGNDEDNVIKGGGGSDFIDGGLGYNDVTLYDGNADDYIYENTFRSEWTVTNKETGETDTLVGIEILTFDDTSVYDYAYA